MLRGWATGAVTAAFWRSIKIVPEDGAGLYAECLLHRIARQNVAFDILEGTPLFAHATVRVFNAQTQHDDTDSSIAAHHSTPPLQATLSAASHYLPMCLPYFIPSTRKTRTHRPVVGISTARPFVRSNTAPRLRGIKSRLGFRPAMAVVPVSGLLLRILSIFWIND